MQEVHHGHPYLYRGRKVMAMETPKPGAGFAQVCPIDELLGWLEKPVWAMIQDLKPLPLRYHSEA